jgi:3-(3-hydroxy-phenyl)propionate hydroxylase
VVEYNGVRDRFDQAVGIGWMVIGFNTDPATALDERQIATLHQLSGRTVQIGSPDSDCEVIDVDGTYAQWLQSIDARYFILRPDFYVAATASDSAQLQQRFDEVTNKLHLQQ